MKVLRHNIATGNFGIYASVQEAGPIHPVYTSEEDLIKTKASIAEMTRFYNRHTGQNIKTFRDKHTAAKRIWAAIQEEEVNGEEQEDTQKELHVTEEESEQEQQINTEAVNDAPAKLDRRSSYAGKTVVGVKQVNPRRAGTKGFASYEILREAGEAGVVYEDYIKAGGRAQDLRWDIDHQFAAIKE